MDLAISVGGRKIVPVQHLVALLHFYLFPFPVNDVLPKPGVISYERGVA